MATTNPLDIRTFPWGSLNYDTTEEAAYPRLIEYNSTLYLTFTEQPTGTPYPKVRVKKLDSNGSWVSADNNTPIFYDNGYGTERCYTPCPAVYNNELYIAFEQSDQIRVKKLDTNGNWVSADNNTYLNNSSTIRANYPKLINYNSELYIVWHEGQSSYNYKVLVKKLDSNGDWVYPDPDNAVLNYDTTVDAYMPYPVIYDNTLYIFFAEKNSDGNYNIRAKKLDNSTTTWVSADNGSGVYNLTDYSTVPRPIVYNDTIYVFFLKKNDLGKYQVNASKLDNGVWVNADNNSSLSYDSSYSSYYPKPVVYNNRLYVYWAEDSSQSYKIRGKRLDSNDSWVTADNNTGLNYNLAELGDHVAPVVYNNTMYITWEEKNADYDGQIRVAKMDYEIIRFLINDGGNIKTYDLDNNIWNTLGSSVTEDMYLSSGFKSLGDLPVDSFNQLENSAFSILSYTDNTGRNSVGVDINGTKNRLRELNSNSPKLLAWTDDIDNTKTLNTTAIPVGQLILPDGDIDLSSVSNIGTVSITATEGGNGAVRMIASVDQGTTWMTWDGSQWAELADTSVDTVKNNGMSISVVNELSSSNWNTLVSNSNTLRFAYYLEIDSTSDTANTDLLTMTVDMQGEWANTQHMNEYNYSYDYNDTLTVQILKDGTYKINY